MMITMSYFLVMFNLFRVIKHYRLGQMHHNAPFHYGNLMSINIERYSNSDIFIFVLGKCFRIAQKPIFV